MNDAASLVTELWHSPTSDLDVKGAVYYCLLALKEPQILLTRPQIGDMNRARPKASMPRETCGLILGVFTRQLGSTLISHDAESCLWVHELKCFV